MKGLIHLYTGNGKGKTTAAVGLGIRAWGSGMKVLMVQFLKGRKTGELEALGKLRPGFAVLRADHIKKFTWEMDPEELKELKRSVNCLFDRAVKEVTENSWDVLILDEITSVLNNGLMELKDVIEFLTGKPPGLEVVLTGRNAPDGLTDLADYVSEIKEVKHPFNKGIPARKGIEF